MIETIAQIDPKIKIPQANENELGTKAGKNATA
jgi:hypothetical protein